MNECEEPTEVVLELEAQTDNCDSKYNFCH
jgi:hypothetical protein